MANQISRYIFICCFCSFISLIAVDQKEEHVLEYMYTYFNSSQYQVAGLLDGELLDFQSNILESPVPTKKWNEKEQSFGNTMWQESHAVRQQVTFSFLSIAEDLKRHMQKVVGVGGMVQMRLGCRTIVDHKPIPREEEIGFAEIAYDGEEKMFLDHKTHLWTRTENALRTITQKWNINKTIKYHFTNFLNVNCPVSLNRFQILEQKNSSVPGVYQVPRSLVKPGMVNLTCLITGFYPRSAHVEMNLFRDNVLLSDTEGVRSSGVRPNEDHTYQLMKTVMVNASDYEVYRCYINHEGFVKPQNLIWEVNVHKKGSKLSYAYKAVPVCILIFLVVIWLLWQWIKRTCSGYFKDNRKQNIDEVVGNLLDSKLSSVTSSQESMMTNDTGREPAV